MTKTSFKAYAARRLTALAVLALFPAVWLGAQTFMHATLDAPSLTNAQDVAVVAPPAKAVKAPAPRVIQPVHPATARAVAVFGDSIATGQGLPTGASWVAKVAARDNLAVTNWARPGYAYSGYLGNVSDELDTAYASGLPVPATVIVQAGTNDLGIHDAQNLIASEYAALAVRDSLMQHGAQRVIFCSIIPRGDGHEALRQQFNMWMTLTFGNDFAQVDYFFNPVNAALFAADYQPDRLHPNVAGSQLIADTFTATKSGGQAKRVTPVAPR